MGVDLSGQWNIYLEVDEGPQAGTIQLPGVLQAQGYGNPISVDTSWVSSLHDSFWYEQEEYKNVQNGECLVPFLAQPPRHFLGKAYYEREFVIEEDTDEEWFLRIELTHWRSLVWINNKYVGEDCSLCTAHEIPCGQLDKGAHVLKVCVDNSVQYPYRPDGHGVSDALGATWNGMAGEILLEKASEREKRLNLRQEYARKHPRTVEVREGNFYVDGRPEYFRATHFGGEYPLTGYPYPDKGWWQKMMRIVRAWGLNGIRCHSYCPPEIAFRTADEEGIYLLVECGMWNHFEAGIPMLDVLRQETRRILREFGHHPSFVFFSPSNEPSGSWYQPLREWVRETREYDEALGYAGRRLYTAQSGWFYDVPPAEIEGTDFIYFHRSAYGPFLGGKIRGADGWWGKDYRSSLEGTKLPVVSHELGQWCAYPDFRVNEKFTGYLRGGNFEVYRRQAEKQGLLPYASEMLYASGRQQLRLYKEELEATFRTPQIKGFELLDLHDYLGQGTALVGFLDAFWEEKGYAKPEEFRSFCKETVLLIRCPSYVWRNTQKARIPVEISHFGEKDLKNIRIEWKLASDHVIYDCGSLSCPEVKRGRNADAGVIDLDFGKVTGNQKVILTLAMGDVENRWEMYVFESAQTWKTQEQVLYTQDWQEARAALEQGGSVVFTPWLSDLDYECPALSWANVFWNSQMGPAWGRNLGMVVDEKHPIFEKFPTDGSGGWQWADIQSRARGFHLKGMEQVKPIVRVIDDWNRSLPLALMFEAKVGDGKLFFVSADLEGDSEERPAAYWLKKAILEYVSSKDFRPETELTAQQIEANFFPMLRMQELISEYRYDEDAEVRNGGAMFDYNPQSSVRIEKKDFPVSVDMVFKKVVNAQGFLYLPEQRDRGHEGFLKDYRIEYFDPALNLWKQAAEGTFLNTSLSQKVLFPEEITAKQWRLTVYSCYGCVEKDVWKENAEGWQKVHVPKKAVLQIAGFHVICEEPAEHTNSLFKGQVQKSKTKEIEA